MADVVKWRHGGFFAEKRERYGCAARAGFACGFLDITAALVVYGFFGLKPMRLLQGIASGLLGPKAFSGGLATALLGLLCHFLIAFGAAAVYLVASWVASFLVEHAVVSGVL